MSNSKKKPEEIANAIKCMELLEKFNMNSTLVTQIRVATKESVVAKKGKALDGKKKD
jgi:hypothetical protein